MGLIRAVLSALFQLEPFEKWRAVEWLEGSIAVTLGFKVDS